MYKKIKIDTIDAMKEKNTEKRDILRVVTGEFDRERGRKGRELTEKEEMQIIRKMHSNAEELKNDKEAEILSAYLPQMLEPRDIRIIVKNIIVHNEFTGIQDMGKVMAQLKNNAEAALIDMSTASQITKEELNG